MIAALLLTLAQAATPAPATPATTAAPAEKPKLVCMVEDETGSRLSGKRVCRTKEQWEQMRQQGRAMADRQRGTGAGNK